MDQSRGLPNFDPSLCTRCGQCVEACPCNAIEMTDFGLIFHCLDTCPQPESLPRSCALCSICEDVCPTGAITIDFEIVLGDDLPPTER